jgi:hypothetical protein
MSILIRLIMGSSDDYNTQTYSLVRGSMRLASANEIHEPPVGSLNSCLQAVVFFVGYG